ncbi:MAG: hypothetical protein P4M08_02820 [Oligoflexia bacterium]|nr:hypothetical protein [Oligoflexia bacterium]
MKKASKTILKYPHAASPGPDSTRSGGTREEVACLIQDIARLISNKPEKAAILLADWLNRPSNRITSSRKKAG